MRSHAVSDTLLLFGVDLTNPVTPWVALGLSTIGWLVVYLVASSGSRP